MKQIKLQILYSKDFEKKRILDVRSKARWYKDKGYNVSLPTNKNLDGEYKEKEYQDMAAILLKQWDKTMPTVVEKLLSINLDLRPTYKIFLTQYGTSGSYFPPNVVTLNFKKKFHSSLIHTIIHEIIHLCIETSIQKHNIEHWEKERIVDLIVQKICGKQYQPQKLDSQITSRVDMIFQKYYPNIKKIIQSLTSSA